MPPVIRKLHHMLRLFTLAVLAAVSGSGLASNCAQNSIGHTALQVLGSGGPVADDARASSSYLIWRDGKARVLIDIGGGSILRFAKSAARIEDLHAIAITHTHVDHIGDLPALIKTGFFSSRRTPLPLFGPDGNARFPGIQQYVQGTFTGPNATHRYLDWIDPADNEQPDSHFHVPVTEIDRSAPAATVFAENGLSIRSVGVEHGPVPAVGYVLDMDGFRVAVSGDMNASNPRFVSLARDSDIMVSHLAVAEDASGNAVRLHARPSDIGKMAQMANARRLIISHIMQRAGNTMGEQLRHIRRGFKGRIHVANDMDCFILQSRQVDINQ